MAAPPASDLALQLGEILRAARKRAGLSQEELGVRAGLHRTAVGQLERGERTPRADSVIRLAGSMGIPAGDLLEGIVWNPGDYRIGDYAVTPVEGARDQ
jgi:transcriptional regulator with XRE-family HTH domain